MLLGFVAWWTPAMLIASWVLYADDHKDIKGNPSHIYTIQDFWIACGLGLLGWLVVVVALVVLFIAVGFKTVESFGRLVTRTPKDQNIDWKQFWSRPLIDHRRNKE